MNKTALIAQITGEAYRHMLDWRNEVDRKIIQEQIDRKGKALVIMYDPQPGFAQLTELPAPGTARPHSGPFGGSCEYYFLHTPAGWMLRVTNLVQDTVRFGLTVKVPPLLIDDTAAIHVAVRQTDDPRLLYLHGLMDDSVSERTPTDRASFPIAGESYDKLVAWGWTPERLTEYQYCFLPLSVGCELVVEHPASGARNHLTKDVGW